MKYEEFKKQTSKFVFKDDSSSKWDYKCLNRVQKIQLFPTVKFIGLFNVNEAKRFLTLKSFLFYIYTAKFDWKCDVKS